MEFFCYIRFNAILLLSGLFLFSFGEVKGQCNHPDDIAGLTAIFNALNGPNWSFMNDSDPTNDWIPNCSGCDVSQWEGIVCGNGRVAWLAITGDEFGSLVSGVFPSEISLLSELENLYIQSEGNSWNISGPIPSSLQSLTKLEQLWISNVSFEGTLPNIFGNKPDLFWVVISGSSLDGIIENYIPTSLLSSPNIEMFKVEASPLISGNLPNGFGALTSLNELHFDGTSIEGCFPSDIVNLCGITNVDVSQTNISQTFNDFCTNGSTTCCVSSYLDYNALSVLYGFLDGPNWDNNSGWLDNCDPCNGWFGVTCNANNRVIKIELPGNSLDGSLTTSLQELTELEVLNLSSNSISGFLPDAFASIPNLTDINLIQNDFANDIPPSLGSLSTLENLFLSFNEFTGTIPSSLGNLTNLKILALNGNNLSGTIPSSLGNMTSIDQIQLSDNELTGQIPSSLGNLPVLNFLIIHDNLLDGCFDPNLYNICNAGSEAFINTGNSFDVLWPDFCNTSSTGCSQPDFGALIDLYTSTLGALWTDNTGWADGVAGTNCDPCGISCDSPWYGLTCNPSGEVTAIDLSSNNLTGTLPTTLNQLSLYELNLSNNLISGVLPADLGSLFGVNLSNNMFSGDIPSGYSSFIELNLSDNQLTGGIPGSFSNTPLFGALNLCNNQLCGCYDLDLLSLCSIATNSIISDGNNFDSTWDEFCSSSGNLGECDNGSISCYHPDYEDLAALYTMTGGTSTWTNSQDWLGNCDPCGECDNNTPWYGITCVNNRVAEINLSNNGLTGTLPGNLNDLTELEKLIINNNLIGGELPPDYSNLTNLTQFTAAYNSFEGEIPSEYCAFVPQVNFTFSFNELSGCYQDYYSCFCPISTLPSLQNAKISNGNDFPVPFSAFCATGDGDCSDNCMDFDGVNDRLQITNYSLPNNAFTINFWFKAIDNGNSAETRFFSIAGNGSVLEIGIEAFGSNPGNLWIHDTEASPSVFSFGPFVEDNLWHHATLVRDGTAGEVFFDGTSVHQYTTSGFPPNSYGTTTFIGEYIGGGSNLQGQMDDIAIWDRALTQADITELQTCELSGTEVGLDAFWDFNVGLSEMNNTSIPNIPDVSGNGNDLTIQNIAMIGVASNLVTSTTGVYNSCNICYAPPIAQCINPPDAAIDMANPFIEIYIADVDNGSTSGCGGSLTYSFDPVISRQSITYDCDAVAGTQNITLYVTDASSGLQSSCNATFNLTKDLPQYEALESIFNATGGSDTYTAPGVSGWQQNTGWLTNCDPCGAMSGNTAWFGVTCDVTNSFVTELDLGSNNLVGQIPIEIIDLDSLISLDLSENYLSGPLPALNHDDNPKITTLDFSDNGFVENIPPSYGLLDELTNLSLDDNALDGCYHPNLLNLCTQLGSNSLNGNISDNNSFDNPWEDFCGKTYELALLADFYHSTSGNSWTNTQANNRTWFENCDPCDIANSGANPWFGLVCNANDEILQINMPLGNNLNGILPTSIGDFPALNWIALSGNPGLEGEIPAEICNLVGVNGPNGSEGLRVLQLTSSNLTGEIPSCIADLHYLELLALSENNGVNGNIGIFGPLPAFDQDNTLLQIISIYNTHISGTIPQDYIDLPNLTSLQLQFNYLTGTIPPIGTNQPNIMTLSFHGNYFDGSIPGIFGSLTQLNRFDVYGNQGSFSYVDPNGAVVSGGSLGLSGCYGPQLSGLCQNPNLSLTDNNINFGNPLLGSWEDYCLQGIDRCCPDELIIDWTPVLDGTYKSFGDIILQSQIATNSNVTLSHGTSGMLNTIPPVTINNGAVVLINDDGCN